jgi:hypothetical protein
VYFLGCMSLDEERGRRRKVYAIFPDGVLLLVNKQSQ